MRFEEALNGYIHQIGITAKDLAGVNPKFCVNSK